MTVSFYNEHGCMNGIDIHQAFELPVPVPMQVAVAFSHPTFMWTKKATTVSMDGAKALKSGMDFYLVPHSVPGMGIEPNATLTSGSKAWMCVHSVTVGGDKAATCLMGAAGTNVNCNDPCDSPFWNVVINPNSVITQPTPGDYYGSWLGACVDILSGFGIGQAAKKVCIGLPDLVEDVMNQVWRRTPDIVEQVTKDMTETAKKSIKTILDAPSVVTEQVQQQVDSVLQ